MRRTLILGCACVSALVLSLFVGCSGGRGGGGGARAFTQIERLSRPLMNEVFGTVANDRHMVNNQNNPTDDGGQLRNDIIAFMTQAAGRSQAIADAVANVVVPDVMRADMSQAGPAAFFGVETGGATGGRFGGRALTNDAVDIALGIAFGTTISDLGLAPADGRQIPGLTSDNLGSGGKRFTNTFPYLGAPR